MSGVLLQLLLCSIHAAHHCNGCVFFHYVVCVLFFLQSIEIPALKVTKKVRSMQMYRAPVQRAAQGDRVGICVTQFDSKLLERGLVCSPGHLPTIYGNCGRGGWSGEGCHNQLKVCELLGIPLLACVSFSFHSWLG